MKIYNTLTGRVESIAPIEPGRIKMYSCGPTVYRYIHIGNLRTFTMADWLRRTLLRAGYEVLHVKNITDVGHMRVELLDRGEDKLVAQARKEGKTAAEIAAFYTDAFRQDEGRLNILPAHVFPRATDHVAEMVAIIVGLLEKGIAYRVGGNVYFDVTAFAAYGKLSGNQMAQLLEGVRDAADPNKRNPEDFALWKAAEPGREMVWDSPWGRGFPGWHIECSAMSMKYLGPRFDIHTGGVDNIFPHHEDEIAQSEGYTGQRFVNTWVHAQHLLADGLKMAKSTGNAYTLADVEARGFEPLALRYLYAMTKYRTRLNFTFTALRAAQIALRRLRLAALRLAAATDDRQPALYGGPSVAASVAAAPAASAAHWRNRFTAALEDDLNLPQAMATIWDLLRGRGPTTPDDLRLALLLEFDEVLGFGLAEEIRDWRLEIGDSRPNLQSLISNLPESIAALVRERETLRHAERYAEADALRQRIAAVGYAVRDTRAGPLVERLAPEEEFPTISRSADAPDMRDTPDSHEFSVNLLARDSRADLERCVRSIARHCAGRNLEIVIVDNGSTDDTAAYLQELARTGLRDEAGDSIPLRVLFADHNLGFAAGRNSTMRASCGRNIVLLDTSIELRGDIWTPLAHALADETIGVAGPYGLVTDDLQEFYESAGPDVDAVEGYLMAFRRVLLNEVGLFEEKFRFYRLLDVYESFMFKTSGYRVVALPELATLLKQHPHREWHSLTEEERATRSKRNYDIFKRRWHHGESLLAANFAPGRRWFGHNHPRHVGGTHTHPPEELPAPGQPHSHRHQHWVDHDHEHSHYHR
jgi:cysteinyl-tRNA synthetase